MHPGSKSTIQIKVLSTTLFGAGTIYRRIFHTVVCDYINIKKTTFDFNFGLYQAF